MRSIIGFAVLLSGAAQAWQPPNAVMGVRPGMPFEQVVKQLGGPARCWREQAWCAWETDDESVMSVQFDQGRVRYLYAQIGFSPSDDPSFVDATGMQALLGEPDVYSVSETGYRIRFTYLDSGLTINVDEGQVTGFGLGHVGWRVTATVSEYWVAGRQICPSQNCPFELPSNRVKASYQGQGLVDLYQQYSGKSVVGPAGLEPATKGL